MNCRPSSSCVAVTVMAGAVWVGGAVWSAGTWAGGAWMGGAAWASATAGAARGRMNANPASSRLIACSPAHALHYNVFTVRHNISPGQAPALFVLFTFFL